MILEKLWNHLQEHFGMTTMILKKIIWYSSRKYPLQFLFNNYSKDVILLNYSLVWQFMNETNAEEYPTNINLFVVFEGQGITSFLNETILKNTMPVCQLVKGNASIYHLPNDITICVSEEKDLNLFSAITEKLEKWIKIANRVIGITFQPQVVYKGMNNKDAAKISFIKTLSTDTNEDEYEVLGVPNIVSGVVAGAVTWRKYNNLSATCYAIFLESLVFDSLSTQPIINLLKKLAIPCNDKFEFSKINTKSNLYI